MDLTSVPPSAAHRKLRHLLAQQDCRPAVPPGAGTRDSLRHLHPALCANTAVRPTQAPHPPGRGRPTRDREDRQVHRTGSPRHHRPPNTPTPAPSSSSSPVQRVAREEEGAVLTLGCARRFVPRADPRPTLAASVQAAGQVPQREGAVVGKVHVVVETGNQEGDVLGNKGCFRTRRGPGWAESRGREQAWTRPRMTLGQDASKPGRGPGRPRVRTRAARTGYGTAPGQAPLGRSEHPRHPPWKS